MLLESSSFIRFLPSHEHPRYFCLVRVAHKHPCVVLHIGHVEGTPYKLQLETLSYLTSSLQKLFPGKERGGAAIAGKKSAGPVTKAKPVVTIVGKQLQRVMIRYNTMSLCL